MKYIILILFCTLIPQRDTTRTDTIVVEQSIQKDLDKNNNKLDSIIAILKQDTINKK